MRTTENSRLFFVLMGMGVLLITLDIGGLLTPVRGLTGIATNPIKGGVHGGVVRVGDELSFLGFWRSGETRVRYLEQRNLELLATAKRVEALEAENKDLRAQLGAAPRRSERLVPAMVMGVGSGMEIGVGSQDGIKEGMTVVYLGHLVGRTTKVFPRSSIVELPISPGSKIPVRVGEASGLVTGQFSASMVLDRVAQNEKVNVGDTVLSSGEGEILPGLVVGKVSKITSSQTDIFIQATVESEVNYGELLMVFVVVS